MTAIPGNWLELRKRKALYQVMKRQKVASFLGYVRLTYGNSTYRESQKSFHIFHS